MKRKQKFRVYVHEPAPKGRFTGASEMGSGFKSRYDCRCPLFDVAQTTLLPIPCLSLYGSYCLIGLLVKHAPGVWQSSSSGSDAWTRILIRKEDAASTIRLRTPQGPPAKAQEIRIARMIDSQRASSATRRCGVGKGA